MVGIDHACHGEGVGGIVFVLFKIPKMGLGRGLDDWILRCYDFLSSTHVRVYDSTAYIPRITVKEHLGSFLLQTKCFLHVHAGSYLFLPT